MLCWYPFAHWLHCKPVTPSLQGHCPVVWLQVRPNEPTRWQSHSENNQKKNDSLFWSWLYQFDLLKFLYSIRLTFTSFLMIHWFGHISIVALFTVLTISTCCVMPIERERERVRLIIENQWWIFWSNQFKKSTNLQFKQTPPDFLPLNLNSSILKRHFLAWPLQLQAEQKRNPIRPKYWLLGLG